MNKAPQPTGPPPAPSPGLPQPAFPPGQTAPVVFNPPPATQMNTPSQPRQVRVCGEAAGARGGGWGRARRVECSGPGSSHLTLISSNPCSPVSPYSFSVHYLIMSGCMSRRLCPWLGPDFALAPHPSYPYPAPSCKAGAYYPAQGVQQFPPGVAPAPVMMNQPPQIAPKRERKTVSLSTEGELGIWEGGGKVRWELTFCFSQTGGGLEPQANGETPQVAVIVRPDDRPQGATVGGRPGLGPEHSPSDSPSQPSSPSPAPSPPPPVLQPGPEPSLSVLPITEDTMTATVIMQMTVEEPAAAATAAPCASPGPSSEAEVTSPLPAPEPALAQPPSLLQPPDTEVSPEPNGVAPAEEPEAQLEVGQAEAVPVPPTPPACPQEFTLVAPTAQPEELPNGAPSPPAMDLSPIAEPEEPEEELENEEEEEEEDEEEGETEGEKGGEESLPPETTPTPAPLPQSLDETATQVVAISVPKKRRRIKELNKKETVGDLLDAFKEVNEGVAESGNQSPAESAPTPEPEGSPGSPRPEETEETWEEKEDKIDDAENIQPGDQKYHWAGLEEKKRYDREFLLGFQFIFASMQKPEGLPHISDVVLDKVDTSSGLVGGPGSELPRGPPAGLGPRRSQQGLRKEPRKIIATVLLSEDVKLNKAEKAWKPSSKRGPTEKDRGEEDADGSKTQDLFRRVRSILNKLTPQMFQQLMKQVKQLAIDTEERLIGVIDLIFEKAISEPNFSVAYANMCRCLMGVSAAAEERGRLKEELEEARDIARRRSLGNIKFIGELFKLKMLTEAIMHDCVVKLLKNHDEESLECLCRLLTTIGKDLDFEKAKPRMDQYFNQMEKIIKEKKTSSRIRFMLQDVLDLRRSNWVPRRGDQGPKTIDQIHKEAEMEEHREHIKVQQLMAKGGDKRRGPPGPPPGRGLVVDDGGWNTVPISKGSRPIDTSRITKITKPGSIDSNNQLFAPGGRLSWGKGSSGGMGAKPSDSASETARPSTSTLNRFSALQQAAPPESTDARRVVQRSSLSRERGEKAGDRGDRLERSERGGERGDRLDRARAQIPKRSFSKEVEERSRERPLQPEGLRKAASLTEERDRSRDTVKREGATASAGPPKAALSEEELEKKSKAIIEEFLHLNDMKEAVQCVQELASPSLLFIFVRNGIESTLERSTIAREHMGQLLHQLLCAGHLTTSQYYQGLHEILEVAEDMEIDIPHVWLYLAELVTPILREGGVPMGEFFREISKPLKALGKASPLLLEILGLLCKSVGHKKVGALWREAGLSWKEFLPEDQDIAAFVTEQKVEYTLGEESEPPSRRELSPDELSQQLKKLLKESPNNQRIYDWIEANLSEQQVASNTLVRALMTAVCHSAIIFESPLRLDVAVLKARAKLLQKYVSDEQKELQALYALQALVVTLEQPANLLRMFFDALYDEDVVKEEAFYSWESSKDPAEQQGKGVALKSVTAFFTWLREAEDESDHN
uniref:Eukaryotic translation initiation factor 4 gamma 1 n=1 Tax=Monodelphis domestica TaxID=13616 RepID=F7DF46_MONDO